MTTLPSSGNINLQTVNIETNKINILLPQVSTNNITELNKLIYAGAHVVIEKIGIPENHEKKNRNQDGN